MLETGLLLGSRPYPALRNVCGRCADVVRTLCMTLCERCVWLFGDVVRTLCGALRAGPAPAERAQEPEKSDGKCAQRLKRPEICRESGSRGRRHTALMLKTGLFLGNQPYSALRNVVRTLCRRCADVVYDVVRTLCMAFWGRCADVVRGLARGPRAG